MGIPDLHHPGWTPPHCLSFNCTHHDRLWPGWRFGRMGHHFRLALQLQMIKSRPPLREVVLDSPFSFEQSQYHPCHLHLAVEELKYTPRSITRTPSQTPETISVA